MRSTSFFRTSRNLLLVSCAAASWSATLHAQPAVQSVSTTPRGTIIKPASSMVRREDAGLRAHTNVEIFVPRGREHINATSPSGIFETPASLACVYGVTVKASGCNPATLKTVATGGSKAIAIVDAYDDPNAASDLAVYSKQYGLPAITSANFQVAYATGKRPRQDPTGGWELEETLDVDMVHALAPNAKIILVEAASASGDDLVAAEKVAGKLVAAAGGGEVSNSWGGSDFPGEESAESAFTASGVVFFASTGDQPGPEFPAILTNVVSVGGTVINRSAAGVYKSQASWSQTGGGPSAFVAIPAYQSVVAKIVGANRGTPDIALDASPDSGAWIYDTVPYGGTTLSWLVVGGTSLATPASAALVNNAGAFNASSVAELTEIYANYGNKTDLTDIKVGACSNGGETKAVKGYDFCTGVGTLLGTAGK